MRNKTNQYLLAQIGRTVSGTGIFYRWLFGLLLGFQGFSQTLQAANNAPDIKSITVATVDAYPYAWRDEQGEPHGLIPDLVYQLIAEASPETDVTFRFSSLDRVNHQLLTRQVDMGYGLYNAELEKHARILNHLGQLDAELWSLPESAITSVAHIAGKQIGVAAREYALLTSLSGATISIIPASDRLFHMLAAKRIQGAVEIRIGLTLAAQQANLTRKDFHVLTLDTINAYIWVNPSSPIVKHWKNWQAAAKKVNSPEDFNHLLKRYETQPN